MLELNKQILTKKQLNEFLDLELYRYGSGGLKSFLLNDEAYILRKHAILLRKTEYYINTGKKVLNTIYKMRLNRFQNRYSMHIPVNCCDKGLRIMHVGPILMNSKVTVGENCCFHINTALVAGGTNDAVPTLGDGVVLGIGAIVLGGVYVADNVAIGANAVVNKDVMETNIAVAGVPAKKISNNGRNEWNKGNK